MASAGAASRLYKLYVGNLSWTTSHNDLRNYFSKFGPVNLATVVFDKSTGFSKNFGFVNFEDKASFEKAQSFHPHKLEGNVLKVQLPNLTSSEDQD